VGDIISEYPGGFTGICSESIDPEDCGIQAPGIPHVARRNESV